MNSFWGWRLAALKNGFRDATEYRWELIIEIVSAAIVPAGVQIIFWYALFKLGSKTEVAGMDYAAVLQYTLVSMLFTQVRGGNHDFELAETIRAGTLSNYLLKPMGVVEFIYIRGVAPKVIVASICLMTGLFVGTWFGMSPIRMTVAMLMALIGNVIHYQIGAALSAVAFYWEEAYSVLMVKNLVVSFLSGELIPLNIFPASMQWLWKFTPFYLYVFGPVQIAMGRWSWAEVGQNFVVAFGWFVFGWLLIRTSWGMGIRRYVSLGG